MTPITAVQVPGTPSPVGHYAQAVTFNGLIFVSGQVPFDLATRKPMIGTIEEQTELVLRNTARILEAAGSGLAHALQITVFLTRIEDWPAMNAAYARVLGDHRPARAVVPIGSLGSGARVSVQCIAALPRVSPPSKRRAAKAARGRSVRGRGR